MTEQMRDDTHRLSAAGRRPSARTDDMDDQIKQPAQERSAWNADATIDYPVGPDDAGNAVMHGIGFLIRGWRWLVGTITNRS